MTVSGQVPATKTKPSAHDFTPDVDLAKVVLPLPQQVKGMYLAETEDLKPVLEEGQLIKLFMDHTLDLLKLNGALGITDVHGQPYAGGVKFVERKRVLKNRTFVLQDKDGHPLAMCVEDTSHPEENALRIFGKQPLFEEDKNLEAKMLQKEEDITFYPWFHVSDGFGFVSIEHWDGVEFKAFLRGYPDKKEKAVGMMIKSASNHHDLGYMIKVKRGDKSGWDVTIR